jgi:hypothetical protein
VTIKSFVLAAAAGIASIGVGSAADLPMTKAEAVEYVKVCSAFGPGFFYIPGSDTCLQLSGQIRADYFYTEPHSRKDDATAFRSQLRVRFDARTNTDYGILRSFLELQAEVNGPSSNNGTVNNFAVRRAYLQLGGLTAGFAWSPYSFYDQYYANEFFAPYYGEQGRRTLISYTAQFDKAWAALSIEDGRDHRSGSSFGGANKTYGGSQVPDVVGVIGYDDNKSGWGRFQVMAALHQNRTADPRYDSKYGYAIGVGGNVNIPVLSGGYIAAEADYANGASKYLNAGSPDAYGTASSPYDLDRAKGFSVSGEAGLNITPALQAILFGSYLKYEAPSIAKISDDFRAYTVGGQLNYTLVKGFIAGAEVWYQDKDPEGPTESVHSVGAGMRLRRTF